MAFMLVSNWMGSPEFRVESSAEQEVSQEILPQEGPSILLGVPYENMVPGTFLPGQEVTGNPHLSEALAEFQAAMYKHSCHVAGQPQNSRLPLEWDECEVVTLQSGDKRYGNFFKDSVMPDPYAELRVEEIQPNLLRLTLHYEVTNPDDPEELLVNTDWISYRHADSNYEEECRFANKDC